RHRDARRKALGLVRIDVPVDVDPSRTLIVLQARRMNLVDTNAAAAVQHADDAVTRHRAALLESHRNIVPQGTDWHCRYRFAAGTGESNVGGGGNFGAGHAKFQPQSLRQPKPAFIATDLRQPAFAVGRGLWLCRRRRNAWIE